MIRIVDRRRFVHPFLTTVSHLSFFSWYDTVTPSDHYGIIVDMERIGNWKLELKMNRTKERKERECCVLYRSILNSTCCTNVITDRIYFLCHLSNFLLLNYSRTMHVALRITFCFIRIGPKSVETDPSLPQITLMGTHQRNTSKTGTGMRCLSCNRPS